MTVNQAVNSKLRNRHVDTSSRDAKMFLLTLTVLIISWKTSIWVRQKILSKKRPGWFLMKRRDQSMLLYLSDLVKDHHIVFNSQHIIICQGLSLCSCSRLWAAVSAPPASGGRRRRRRPRRGAAWPPPSPRRGRCRGRAAWTASSSRWARWSVGNFSNILFQFEEILSVFFRQID